MNIAAMWKISTGAGKTLITAMLCLRAEKYGRTITIVPNRDLVTQTFKDYDLIGLDVGVFFGSQKTTLRRTQFAHGRV